MITELSRSSLTRFMIQGVRIWSPLLIKNSFGGFRQTRTAVQSERSSVCCKTVIVQTDTDAMRPELRGARTARSAPLVKADFE